MGRLVLLLVASLAASPAHGRVIAVAGWGSDGDTPGLFETAELLSAPGREPFLMTLPGGHPNAGVNHLEYLQREDAVYAEAERVLRAGESVELLGFSHGAILVLRVAHRLARDGVPLANLSLVTLDPVPFEYPDSFTVFLSVPAGVGRTLNLFQSVGSHLECPLCSFFVGEEIRGALNVSVSGAVLSELFLGPLTDPTAPRFKPSPAAPHHTFMDDSLTVQRRILTFFDRDVYLPGFWSFSINGTVASGPAVISDTILLLEHTNGRAFVARTLFGPPTVFITFQGDLGDDETLSGTWLIPFSRASAFVHQDASGDFTGTTDLTRMDLAMRGWWPVSTPGELFTHLEPFDGTATVTRWEFPVDYEELVPLCRRGDVNCDGAIDHADMGLLRAEMGRSVDASDCGELCDLDGDGRISMLDARILRTLCDRPGCRARRPSSIVRRLDEGAEPAVTARSGRATMTSWVLHDRRWEPRASVRPHAAADEVPDDGDVDVGAGDPLRYDEPLDGPDSRGFRAACRAVCDE